MHKYLYANGSPATFSDPSGEFTLVELTTAINIRVTLAVSAVGAGFARGASVGGAMLRNLGNAVENETAALLNMLIANQGAVQRGVWLVGEGGRRKLDFWVEAANRIAIIEVKYKIPSRAGDALSRLVGQIQTAATDVEAYRRGAQVVLYTFRAPTDAEMQRLVTALGENAGFVQHVSGFTGLVQWVRLFFGIGFNGG